MNLLQFLQIFTLVTGAIYLIMQILQNKYMWYVYIPSCAAQACVYLMQSTWAFFALNLYYIVMCFVGIYNWKKDAAELKAEGKEKKKDSTIHLNRFTHKELWISAAIVAIGIPGIYFAMKALGDPNPLLDSFTTTLSIIATWWLTRSHIQQWFMWIIADIFAIGLNISLGNWWFVALYSFYILSSFFGVWNWYKNGVYLAEQVPEGN